MTLKQKIEKAKEGINRDKLGKYRKMTIVERCGFWTISWVMLWSILAGTSWTYVYDHRNEIIGTKINTIAIAHAETYIDTKNDSETPQNAKFGEFTAYNAEIGQTDSDPLTMASGKKVYEGSIANNCLDFGTKVKVNGKIKVVEDRMNSRYDCDHFDIYMQDHDAAMNFGRQTIEYEIIK